MIRFVNGGSMSDLKPPIKTAVLVAADISHWIYKQPVEITSTIDGQHMAGSLHYSGLAVDIRTRNYDDPAVIAGAIRSVLGNHYDVILEPTHIHIEYDPK